MPGPRRSLSDQTTDPAVIAKVEVNRRRRVNIESKSLEMLERHIEVLAIRIAHLEPKSRAYPENAKLTSAYDRTFSGLISVAKALGISGRMDPTSGLPKVELPPDRAMAVRMVIAQIKDAMTVPEQVEIVRGLSHAMDTQNVFPADGRRAVREADEIPLPAC